jgi:hypothetical protein
MSTYPAFSLAARVVQQLCDVTTENYPAETAAVCLGCPFAHQGVANVTLAEFGTVAGSCAAGFTVNQSCRADPAKVSAAVARQCVGASRCSVVDDADVLGVPDPCTGVFKQLAVVVACGGDKLCDLATENWPDETNSVTVGCDGNGSSVITKVIDAEFGELSGADCPTVVPAPGGCLADPAAVRSVVEARCLGKVGCTIPANVAMFGKDPCSGVVKQLVVRVQCGGTGAVVDRWSAVPEGWVAAGRRA